MKHGTIGTRRSTTLGLLAASLSLGGCAMEAAESSENLDKVTEELRCANNLNDANCPWKALSRQTPSNANNDISHQKSPALCAGDGSTGLTITVDTNSRYRTLQWQWINSSSWASYGTKAFSSRPACSLREKDSQGRNGFVLAGKATDNKIYAAAGRMSLGGNPQGGATAVETWAAVSSTTYSSGGGPALARGGFGADAIAMVFMSGNRIYAHTRAIPYLSNSWSSRIGGPTLPTGWNVVGAPAIAKLPVTFQIVVHARNGTQDRLFETHFFIGSQTHFSNSIGSPAQSWTMLPDMGTIDDEPALTFSDVHGSTVYFRRGTQIMQTSGALGSNPVLAVKPNAGVSFAGSPAAIANWAFESQNGTHSVVGRTTSNQMYLGYTNVDSGIVP